jgi:flagellar hook-length control protein FliK
VLTAKLEAETTAARNLIMENLPALRERLAQQDVRIERFDVDVRRDGGGSGGGAAGDHGAREQFAERSAWRQEQQQRMRTSSTGAERAAAAPGAKPQADASGLDVRV